MKQLLFIGHKFHTKTKSCDFLFEILEQKYQVEKCFVNPDFKDLGVTMKEFAGRKFDVLVCWQVMPDLHELSQYVSYDKGVFFPMYDGCPRLQKTEKWYQFRNFQIISFSKTLCAQLKWAGFCAEYVQFFPKPNDAKSMGDEKAVFFWNRRESINVNVVGKLFAKYPLDLLHIHKALDPNQAYVEPKKQYAKQVEYSTWYEQKDEMMNDIEKCAFYVAPREKEGIGMSFLEAMAMGRVVVAPKQATMNEYIKHGVNGYLYDLSRPRALKIRNVRKIQENCLQFIKDGYDKWQKDKKRILDLMEQSAHPNLIKIQMGMLRRFCFHPLRVVGVLKKFGFKHTKRENG